MICLLKSSMSRKKSRSSFNSCCQWLKSFGCSTCTLERTQIGFCISLLFVINSFVIVISAFHKIVFNLFVVAGVVVTFSPHYFTIKKNGVPCLHGCAALTPVVRAVRVRFNAHIFFTQPPTAGAFFNWALNVPRQHIAVRGRLFDVDAHSFVLLFVRLRRFKCASEFLVNCPVIHGTLCFSHGTTLRRFFRIRKFLRKKKQRPRLETLPNK